MSLLPLWKSRHRLPKEPKPRRVRRRQFIGAKDRTGWRIVIDHHSLQMNSLVIADDRQREIVTVADGRQITIDLLRDTPFAWFFPPTETNRT